MKLSNFEFEQLSTTELQQTNGGKVAEISGGITHSGRRTTVCTGSDHDAGSGDSD